MNKRIARGLLAATIAAIATIGVTAAQQQDNVITRLADGTRVVNTKTLAPEVRGFQGPTPLKIYIKAGKIEKVEALPNKETPKYFARVKMQLLKKYQGMKATRAAKAKLDGVTGATLSSNAVKENMRRGLDYYKRHK